VHPCVPDSIGRTEQVEKEIVMGKETILVVDDEEDIQELIKLKLVKEGYKVLTTDTGENALELVQEKRPTLVILDLMLPGIDGLEVCRKMKNSPKTQHIPIIMLTAKTEATDIVLGLELGADDYVTKPFSLVVLVARIRRILRKKVDHSLDRNTVKVRDLTIDPARCQAAIKGKQLSLTYSEFNILYTLARRAGMVFTRYQIINSLRGYDYVVSDRAVDVQITYLRKKLGPHKDYIETVRGVGYRFKG
jgi:two-component system phosphate regulon response regulator PhoB